MPPAAAPQGTIGPLLNDYIKGTGGLTIKIEEKEEPQDGNEHYLITVCGQKFPSVGIGDPDNYLYEISELVINNNSYALLCTTPTHGGMSGTQIPLPFIIRTGEHELGYMVKWFKLVKNAKELLKILLIYYLIYIVAIKYSGETFFAMDPWNEPYIYQFPRKDGHKGFLLFSKGPDGLSSVFNQELTSTPPIEIIDEDNIPASEPGKW